MKLPPKKSTLFLAIFLVAHGGLRILHLHDNPTLQALTALSAIAAGAFLWIER